MGFGRHGVSRYQMCLSQLTGCLHENDLLQTMDQESDRTEDLSKKDAPKTIYKMYFVFCSLLSCDIFIQTTNRISCTANIAAVVVRWCGMINKLEQFYIPT